MPGVYQQQHNSKQPFPIFFLFIFHLSFFIFLNNDRTKKGGALCYEMTYI